MAAKKYYAVRVGRNTGVFNTWDECRKNVIGYPGAVYKSFPTKEEAENFAERMPDLSGDEAGGQNSPAVPVEKPGLKNCASPESGSDPVRQPDAVAYAFVDGSYNIATGVYGFGGFLNCGGQRYTLSGSGQDPEMSSMRNVAGEILGSRAAVEKALELGEKQLIIYYDYMGIQMWAEGSWKRNKKGTAEYYDFMQSVKDRIRVSFIKVKGHSGVEGNEEADRLAKEAAGVI